MLRDPFAERPGEAPGTPVPAPTESVVALADRIAAEVRLPLGRLDRVQAGCEQLESLLVPPLDPTVVQALMGLAGLFQVRAGRVLEPVLALMERAIGMCPEPWPLVAHLLQARTPAMARRGLDLLDDLAAARALEIDRTCLCGLAERVQAEGSPLATTEALNRVAAILKKAPAADADDFLPRLLLEETDPSLRGLAARLLDLDHEPAPAGRAERILGKEAFRALQPLLDYTRASHRDLIALAGQPGAPSPCLASLLAAREKCPEVLLREVVAELGWERLNLALVVCPYVAISVTGSFPLLVDPSEAPLFEASEGARRTGDLILFVAHGGSTGIEWEQRAGADDPVARFRSYNLAHAEALSEILDVAPLTRQKVSRILALLDRIVEDFHLLFTSHTDEAAIVSSVYGELKTRVLRELECEDGPLALSPELTRLVQMFEDPSSLGGVRTLHGLKRYLHQRGLQLGFRLVEASRATNRTVDLVVASPRRILRRFKGIRYVDFEPAPTASDGPVPLPYPVQVVADGFGRQLLHGQESFPGVRIFCYGNEVHYYVAYGSHPAFLRVDFSPPAQGGMIDLQYYGVSKNELSKHPNLELDAVRLFFRQLQYDVQIENTRVHARYDKERARDLGDLCDRAEALFRLAPYLMDLDWVVGDLDLPAEARLAVARAWAESFESWGVLPLGQLLTHDRRGILTGIENDASGEREVRWGGEGPYQDRFGVPPPAGFHAALRKAVEALGLDDMPLADEDQRPAGQMDLERRLLHPLQRALAAGELVVSDGTVQPASQARFRRVHEAEEFAGLLNGPEDPLATSARLARILQPLERTLAFRTTGTLNGHEVQRARLPLRGEALILYGLRDPQGMLRLALFSGSEGLCRRRQQASHDWVFNGRVDPLELVCLLRRSNYCVQGDVVASAADERPADLRTLFARENPHQRPNTLPGERILPGIAASPGRAVGPALFGSEGRRPEDLDGAVLVASAIRPADNAFLYRAAGIVSTGGGILSHAGLLAAWFRKPALIIPGQWQRPAKGRPVVVYPAIEYREEERDVAGYRVVLRRDLHERARILQEGDLVVVDADAGVLQVLGQDQVLRSLHESLAAFTEAGRRLDRATDDGEILALRGRRLRARHQLERLLARVSEPVVARHAVGELLLGAGYSGEEREKLLRLLLSSAAVAEVGQRRLREIARDLGRRHRNLREQTRENLPHAATVQEVLNLRLDVIHLRQALLEATGALKACGFSRPGEAGPGMPDVDRIARRRLNELRDQAVLELERTYGDDDMARARHWLQQVEWLDVLLGTKPGPDVDRKTPTRPDEIRAHLATRDDEIRKQASGRRLLSAREVGHELWPMVGWKAANLGETQRLAGEHLVPPWFVVTHGAFEEVMDTPLARLLVEPELVPPGAITMREAVDWIVARVDLDPPQKASLVRSLFERAVLPPDLSVQVQKAYRALGPGSLQGDDGLPFVAVRSSALEEDAEAAARAGEFDTYLFVKGEVSLIDHLKRAWSGLWNERAIHNRALVGGGAEPAGGGVIVQCMVSSRVSGVLQTVHVAQNQPREIVINAGLGLGEGIVSGTVAADQITVSKDGDLERGPLRFHYVTADKTEQVIFNRRAGHGTMLAETLYHQRLRPALEYVELLELVADAVRLERVYGQPLDIEFGIDDARHWILQVRPVTVFLAVLRETLEHYPLGADETTSRRDERRTTPEIPTAPISGQEALS